LILIRPQTKTAPLSSPKTPQTPTTAPKGLAASKFAEEDVDSPIADAKSEKEQETTVEGEHDSSSAALASVREPSPNSSLVSFLDANATFPKPVHAERNQRRVSALTDNF
jgi:hypothetical protein